MPLPRRLVAAALAALPLVVHAEPVAPQVKSVLTSAGFTGLGLTPNAHLLDWGRFEFAYDRQLPGITADPGGHNFVGAFGLLPNMEVSGRIAANTMHAHCFFEPCGVRDLSASVKAGIGLDAGNRFRVAVGATDVGGSATYFRSYYGVLTYDEGPYQLSAGIARRSNAGNRSRVPLHGAFASAAWQPVPWLRGHLEYTDGNAWAGLRFFAPQSWLPEGWSAHVGANVRLGGTDQTERTWLTAGVSIPLYKVPSLPGKAEKAPLPTLEGNQKPLPAYEARALPSQGKGGFAFTTADDDALHALAKALQDRGLEDIAVGRMPDGSIVARANNATYNWNMLDAVGSTLGGIADVLGNTRTAYRLILTQRQIPLVAVTGQTDCLYRWIHEAGAGCPAGELTTPGTTPLEELEAGATWLVRDLQPSTRTLRVSLSPVLRTNVATEFGVLDYSAGARLGLSLPVWKGGSLEWALDHEIDHSGDYAPSGVFGSRRIRNGTERIAFVQSLRLPVERWLGNGDPVKIKRWGLSAVTAQATVGRIGGHFDGAHAQLRWEPNEGRHRVTAQAGVFHNADHGLIPWEPRNAKPVLATYRYNVASTRTYFEVTGGRFMHNDRGFIVGMRQWFSDVSVHAYLKRTRGETGTRSFAGVELSIPLGPRRDMNPRGVQFTGTPRFTHGLETLVGSPNTITSGRGALPPVPSLDLVHNADRSSLLYFEDNVRRIRDAAR